FHFFPERRQYLAELDHAFVFDFVAYSSPSRMVAILLAAFGIAASGLDMAISRRTYPYLLPSRRYGKRLDTGKYGCICNRFASDVNVTEPATDSAAPDTGILIAHIT